MKRFLIRLGILAGVVVLGMIAIAQAQRGSKGSAPAAAQRPASQSAIRSAAASGEQRSAPRSAIAEPEGPFAQSSRQMPPQDQTANDRYAGRYGREAYDAGDGAGAAPGAGDETDDQGIRRGAGQDDPDPPPATQRWSNEPPQDDPFAQHGHNDQASGQEGDFPVARDQRAPQSANPLRAARQSPALREPPDEGQDINPGDSGPAIDSADQRPAARPGTGPRGWGGTPPDLVEPRRLDEPPGSANPLRNGQGAQAAGRREPFPAETGSAPFDPFSVDGGPGGAEPARGAGRPSDLRQASLDVPQGTGRPGSQQLEGVQAPSLTIHKVAPEEIQVGKPASFEIVVRNVGQVTARGVEVHDLVPKGTSFIAAAPQVTPSPQGDLLWKLGTLAPGEERVLKVELMPVAEGEIGSVATVHFSAAASVRVVSTRPELRLEVGAPREVHIGESLVLRIKVWNPGTGAATGVVLSEHVPPGLSHPAGGLLEYEVGALKPNESRELELTLTASKAGLVTNLLTARDDGSLRVEEQTQLHVIAPALEVAISGPKLKYLERQATYNITVINPGTASARGVQLAAILPRGLKFLEANNYGEFDPETNAVRWELEELPAGQRGVVTLSVLPLEIGEQKIAVESIAQRELFARDEHLLTIEGVSAIFFEVADESDAVEVGSETAYEIRVVNQGSKAATNVQILAELPSQLKFLGAEGPVRHTLDGDRVLFDPLPKLAPRADTAFRIRVQGLRPGDLRVRVQLLTAEMESPVTKEESTRVYADE